MKIFTYTILVTSSYSKENSKSALFFSQNLVENNHIIDSIFFYGDGVYNSNNMVYTIFDDFSLIKKWYDFSKDFSVNLNVCSSFAQDRGIISDEISKNMGFKHGNLHFGFRLTGLGHLITSIIKSDRLLQF
ncbi:sulfurtransferase complex subunit TusD [Buchnera aphidicola]|uniref:sulfurtransferase complex subunit TusD n=1 Tax=Buchnera aphidicola TaxID=9 RepID=UPI003463E46A